MKSNRIPVPDYVSGCIKAGIDAGEFMSGSRLPSVVDLSRKLGVSKWAVQTGLSKLAKSGYLEIRHRSGAYVKVGRQLTFDGQAKGLEAHKSRAGEIAEEIVQDIAEGNYRAGDFLPIRKAMRFSYGISSRCLRAALERVEARGFITRKGNLFLVGKGDNQRKPLKSCLRVLCPTSKGKPLLGIKQRQFMLSLEGELGEYGVNFQRGAEEKDGASPNSARTRRKELAGIYRVAGTHWTETIIGNDQRILEKELRSLAAHRLPVVICDPWRLLHRFPDAPFRRHKNLFFFSVDNPSASEELGIYLAVRGHMKAAFFSYSSYEWDQARYQGAKSGLRRVWGNSGTVEHFCAGVKGGVFRRNPGRQRRETKKIVDQFIADFFNGYRFARSDSMDETRTLLLPSVISDHHHQHLAPLFEGALARKEITTWICSDPTVAMAASVYLSENNVDVPGRISLASIDDNSRTLDYGITAYDMRVAQKGYLAAHCILGDLPVKRDSRNMVQCPGRVIERGSVAKVWRARHGWSRSVR